MRTIQEIFDIAMAEGGYRPVGEGMCAALKRAWIKRILDFEEYADAKDEIEEYLKELAGDKIARPEDHFLITVLSAAGLPCDEEAQLKIYKDWANRPRR